MPRSDREALPSALDDRVRFAIEHKRLIEVTYNGSVRVAEPHDYGMQRTLKLLVYQHRAAGGSFSGWRLLEVAKIEALTVLEETFRGSRGMSHARHMRWDVVFARVR